MLHFWFDDGAATVCGALRWPFGRREGGTHDSKRVTCSSCRAALANARRGRGGRWFV